MRTEKVILSFIAVLVGLIAAGIAFYLYQSSKIIPRQKTSVISINPPTPTSQPSSFFLSIDRPEDEDVVQTKTITISGKTTKDALIVISTDLNDQVITPAKNGDFSTTITIGDEENIIHITAIAPNGKTQKAVRTITYSTESF